MTYQRTKTWKAPKMEVCRMTAAQASTIGVQPTDGQLIVSGGQYVPGLTAYVAS